MNIEVSVFWGMNEIEDSGIDLRIRGKIEEGEN